MWLILNHHRTVWQYLIPLFCTLLQKARSHEPISGSCVKIRWFFPTNYAQGSISLHCTMLEQRRKQHSSIIFEGKNGHRVPHDKYFKGVFGEIKFILLPIKQFRRAQPCQFTNLNISIEEYCLLLFICGSYDLTMAESLVYAC